jgi:glycosyltransferase involved in cell wall biosynthesis
VTDSPLIYLLCEGFAPTVMDSQVLDTVAALAQHGAVYDICSFVGAKEWLSQRRDIMARRARYAKALGRRVWVVPSLRTYSPIGRQLSAAELVAAWPALLTRPGVIHARGHFAAAIGVEVARRLPNVKVLYDVRGDALAEAHQSPIRAQRHIREVIQFAAKGASAVSCVSNVLREKMTQEYGVAPEKCFVVPCLADAEKFYFSADSRAQARKRLGLGQECVLIYPGSVGRWHFLEPTLQFVRNCMELDPRVFFVALTPEVEALTSLCAATLPARRFKVLAASHREVPEWLRAADGGLLLRERHPINAVAAPTKFAEYALCGLPVAISDGVGDYSELVQRMDTGVVIRDPLSLSEAGAFMAKLGVFGTLERVRWAELATPMLSKGARTPWLARLVEHWLANPNAPTLPLHEGELHP